MDNLQALRGVAVLLVVASHAAVMEAKYFQGVRLLPAWFSAGEAGVDLFFVISGFAMVFSTGESASRGRAVAEFLYRRCTRIYPLYWGYSLLVLGVFLADPALVNSRQGHRVRLVESFLLLPQELLPLLGVGWSLVHEMYFYVVFAGFLAFSRRWDPWLWTGWAFAVVVGRLAPVGLGGPVWDVATHPFTLEFIAGAVVGRVFLSGRGRSFAILPWAALAVWVGAVAVFSATVGGFRPESWLRLLVYGVPACLGVWAITLRERDGGCRWPGWIRRVGDASYSIYLSHLLVVSGLGRFWGWMGTGPPLVHVLALGSLFAAAVVAGIGSHVWVEAPLQRCFRRVDPFRVRGDGSLTQDQAVEARGSGGG